MKQDLLKEMETGSKNALLKKRIITHYIYNGSSTITDLAKELDLSVPTITKFINEMCEDNYINDYGKLETSSGRHPSLYGLNPESGYFIGVDIKKFAINIGLINFKGDMVEIRMNIPYKFENTHLHQHLWKSKSGIRIQFQYVQLFRASFGRCAE